MLNSILDRLRNSLLSRFYSKSRSVPPPFFLNEDPSYSSYRIGEWSYGKPRVFGGESGKLTIGRFCSIADGVTILLGSEHRTDWITTYPFNVLFDEGKGIQGHPATKGDVVIGNDVWIGMDAFILSGVTIGNGAVIAARSIVTKDVEPYSIVGGNPAKHIRFRFAHSTIQKLEKIAWWDWPLPRVVEALPLLLSNDIEAFIEKYGEDHAESVS